MIAVVAECLKADGELGVQITIEIAEIAVHQLDDFDYGHIGVRIHKRDSQQH